MNNLSRQFMTRGSALLIFLIFFTVASTVLAIGIGRGVYSDLIAFRTLYTSKQSLYAAEAGIEDAIYRYRDGRNYSSTENFSFSGIDVAVSRTGTPELYTFVSEGNEGGALRRSTIELAIGSGVSFGFGLQSGNGGLSLANTSSVHGNVFSNGTVTGSGNMVYGDVISAGATGLVDSIHATGTAWAHTITGATIDVSAYYWSIAGTVVAGAVCAGNPNCHPGSTDQATRTMPIAQTVIDEWKTTAANGGEIPLASCSGGVPTGTYTIGADQTIGPIKIPCNFEVTGNSTVLTVAGPVWVVGNISTQNGPTIQADPGVANRGVAVIADNESDRTTSSKISIQGSTGFLGAAGDSYVLMLSMNDSAANGGTEVAIDVDNNTPGSEREVIYYTPNGKLVGRNSLLLRGATAHQISLMNSASVYYETGMADPLFTGSGGGYTISAWREIE